MARRHVHYERAFEAYLRARRIPYIAVDEARRALLPGGGDLRFLDGEDDPGAALKSFDFVIYGAGTNLLVDIKGRRVGRTRSGAPSSRLESWVTAEDVSALTRWEALFGPGFEGVFVFVYACEDQPPDSLFEEIFEHGGVWYMLRSVTLGAYKARMKQRSPRWRTVDLPAEAFARVSEPFAPSGDAPGAPAWLPALATLGRG